MDQIKEGEDPSCWTPDSLRKCQSLTLASDVALLKCMQTLSLRMVSSANNLLKDLDSLNEDTTSACVEVEYCIQNLNLISTKQFMEKRVYDEEVTEKREESTSQIQPVIAPIDFVPKIKEAIREGLPAVKLKITNFEEQINGNSSQSLSRNINSHYSRSLPYLLGTEEFIDSPTVGVAEGHKFKSGSASNLQLPIQTSNSTLSSVQSSPTSLKSNLQVPVPVDNRVHSDSDVSSMSEAGGGISNENKEIDEKMKRPVLSNLQEELSARLRNAGDSKLKTTSEAYVTPNAKVPVKSESQRQELENSVSSHILAASQPKTEIVPSKEIINPPKTRNLFDDSSSESEGELFRSNLPKIPAVPSNIFNQPESKLPPTTPQLTVAKSKNTPTFAKTKTSILFGSSDSEDDLFSGAITSVMGVKSIGKIAANFSDDDDHNIFSSQIAKPKNSQLPPTIKVAVPQSKSGSLYDDEDVPDFVAKKSIFPVTVAEALPKPQEQQPILQTKQPKFEQPQQRNLFADSEDSDDDLFRNIVVTKNKAPALVVTPKTLSSSPLPDKLVTQSSRHQSTPIQNSERKEEQEDQKRPASVKDNDNKPIHIEQHPKLKAKPSLLFDDDEDDEDLFGVVSVSTKHPPLITKVPVLLNVQKDSKGKDLFTDVPPPKAPVLVAEVIVDSADDLFSEVLPEKQTSLPGTPFIAQKPETPAYGSAFGGVAQVTEKPTSPLKVPDDPMTIKMPSDKNVSASTSLLASSKTPMSLPVNMPDNLFGSQPPTLQTSIHQQIPALKAFEESDEEDLFATKIDKRPSQPVPLKISTKAEDIQPTLIEDLFVGIVEQKQPQPPVISTKAHEKIETSNIECDSRQSPETEVEPQAPVETRDKIASRIASLKLSLAKQPHSLPFMATGSSASTPNDEETPTSNSVVRKPFGGVPLFGPRIPSPVKSHPPSPTKAEQKIMSGDSQNKNNEEVAQHGDVLDCVSRQRPKAPSRRLPSRNFRRSQIQDDDNDSIVTKTEETIQLPKETTPVVVNEVVTPPLPSPLKPNEKEASPVLEGESKPANRSLFDDSDSSDGELFKTSASETLSKAEAHLRKGGLRSNAKINSTLMGSGTDDSVLSNQSSIPTPKKVTTPSFLLADSDDDDDLFASTPKLHNRPKPNPSLVVSGNKAAPAASDPLLHFQQ